MSEQRLFISHASEDAAVAERIVAYLEARGVPCWISSRDIPPRAIYADAITAAVRACSACAVVLSKASNQSKAVKRELELTSHYDKAFIPIRIDATEPAPGVDYYLRNTQWLDYKRDGDRALDRIVAQTTGASAARVAPAPPPKHALPMMPLLIAGALVVVGVGGWLAWSTLTRPTAIAPTQTAADRSIAAQLVGSYYWEGVACGAGPTVTLDGDVLVFAMPGTPTYRHAIESATDGVVRTQVLEPDEHQGETYEMRVATDAHGVTVTSSGQTDVWSKCDDPDSGAQASGGGTEQPQAVASVEAAEQAQALVSAETEVPVPGTVVGRWFVIHQWTNSTYVDFHTDGTTSFFDAPADGRWSQSGRTVLFTQSRTTYEGELNEAGDRIIGTGRGETRSFGTFEARRQP
jgi:hypothetical protein